MKVYNQAPLPFMGQKRKFLKQFKEKLKGCSPTGIYIDLFGGSGLLSRAVKDTFPDATVIYNDFDNYEARIRAIDKTNALLKSIRAIVRGLEKDKRMPGTQKSQIIKLIQKQEGYVDYITLSSNLLFSMKYVKSLDALKKETFYNTVRESDYSATGYLKGLKIVRMDYKKLFEKYKNKPEIILLVDPPYLSTETGTYTGYWKLADYLDVLTLLNSHSYFYFTSNKSHIIELCGWMSSQSNYPNPFSAAAVSSTVNNVNYVSSYTDIMVFKDYNVSV